MRVCSVCKKQIKNKDKICVISYPITANERGAYQLMGEFIDKEKVVHFHCFARLANDLLMAIQGKPTRIAMPIERPKSEQNPVLSYYKEIIHTLNSMGDNVNMEKILDFVKANGNINNKEEFLNLWFSKRSSLKN